MIPTINTHDGKTRPIIEIDYDPDSRAQHRHWLFKLMKERGTFTFLGLSQYSKKENKIKKRLSPDYEEEK